MSRGRSRGPETPEARAGEASSEPLAEQPIEAPALRRSVSPTDVAELYAMRQALTTKATTIS